MRSTPHGGRSREEGSSAAASSGGNPGFSGIHHRRDKRFPMQGGSLTPAELQEAQAYELEQREKEDQEVDSASAWNEALMLWLSWNSTYEKVTAKMCKPGQDSGKLERLMDEMDQLRSQAIKTTEQLLGADAAV